MHPTKPLFGEDETGATQVKIKNPWIFRSFLWVIAVLLIAALAKALAPPRLWL